MQEQLLLRRGDVQQRTFRDREVCSDQFPVAVNVTAVSRQPRESFVTHDRSRQVSWPSGEVQFA